MRKSTRHFLELLMAMTEKELRARYKYTLLGFVWLVANPVIQMLVIGLIFRYFMKNPLPNYFHYLFTGLLIWNFFSLSLTKTTTSILGERTLISKARFPTAVIPLSVILSNFIHFTLAFILFLIPIALLGTARIAYIGHVILGLALLIVFTVGLGLLTSALNVKFRDTAFFVQAALIPWFYASPIMYSFDIIPREIIWVWRLNPLTSVLQLFQHALFGMPGPGMAMFAVNATTVIAVFIAGVIVFRNESKFFDDWI